MRIGEPPTAGTLIAASVGSTTLPVQGPLMPSQVVTQAPEWSATEARDIATQYATGLGIGYTLNPQLSQGPSRGGQALGAGALALETEDPRQVRAPMAGEALALEIQDSLRASASLMKHPLGTAAGIALMAGTIGGIVLREAGQQWDNDSVTRIGKTIADISGFASTLLRPDGRLSDGIVGGIVVTADLCGLAQPGSRQVVDNPASALQAADNLVFHHDTLLRTIALGASELSLDPLGLPDL
jgi:hypothetical protein